MLPVRHHIAVVTLGLLGIASAGCSNGFLFGWGAPEGVIHPSLKPYQPPVLAPVTGAAPVPFVPDPPHLVVNKINGMVLNADTNQPVLGTQNPLPGESPIPSSDPNIIATAADSQRANYIPLGNTLLVETSGLTPGQAYVANLIWPDGTSTKREFKGNPAGNIQTDFNEPYLEYPHSGFFRKQMKGQVPSTVPGNYRVEITKKDETAVVQTLNFYVRPRPIVFLTDENYVDAVHFFTDQPAKIFIHGEGFQPNQTVHIWMIKDDVGHLTPLKDGTTLPDKVFDRLGDLSFQCNDKGVFTKALVSWNKRDNPEDEAPMVVIAKTLNNSTVFNAAEDTAIVDHPAMTLVSTAKLQELMAPYPNVPTSQL